MQGKVALLANVGSSNMEHNTILSQYLNCEKNMFIYDVAVQSNDLLS